MPHRLRATDCPLLLPQADADPAALRMVQRLLEIALSQAGVAATARSLLEEVAAALRADGAAVWEAAPEWKPLWQHVKPGIRFQVDAVPRAVLADVLDRQESVAQEHLLAVCLSFTERPNRVLTVHRPRERFGREDLEYAVAAGHYLGMAIERARGADQAREMQERLRAILAISRQLAQQRDTVPLLEHIAEQAAQLLRCERASIFVWDRLRQELVARPALGLPGGELRIPDTTGVVGKVVHKGTVEILQDVRDDPTWAAGIDRASGFQTRNLLCVPLTDAEGQRLGALEVMNKADRFTAEDAATLEALADQAAAALTNVREREALVRSHNQLDEAARLAARIVGATPAIQALRATVARVAYTDLPVLILGESGTGKDVIARAVHYSSPRAQAPYVPVNCAAIAESLLESELFGYEKGAFTGAEATRAGKFEAASGGTLFLDEIGDLSAGGQAKLLRVLEEKVVYRVGGTQPIPVDTRIVAATNRNLVESVRAGKFREDLYYRLTVVTLDLPALRDRRDDILVLAEHFLTQFCKEAGRKALKLSAAAKQRLASHDWPGNVRELRNLLERVAYLCPKDKIDEEDLAFILPPLKDEAGRRFSGKTLAEATDLFQREHIQHALDRAGGHVGRAAELLGLYRPNLYRKMRQLGMGTE
jgi:transcriptional regulator with GAF, ATPase, and Fis domain